jgi:hypothetical protein
MQLQALSALFAVACSAPLAPAPQAPHPSPAGGGATPAPKTAPAFGFDGFEIYKLGDGAAQLSSGDWNGDGLLDLAAIVNTRSRIELLVRRRTGDPDAEDLEVRPGKPNQPRYDGRYLRVRVPVERRVHRLAMGDFDGDGRAEVAFAAEDGDLGIVAFTGSGEPGRTAAPVVRHLNELTEACSALHAADFDGDGRTDLLLASGRNLWCLRAQKTGGLGAPERVDVVDGGVDVFAFEDLDGDGRRDLAYVHLEEDFPVRYRLRREDGGFGPRFEIELPQLRSAAFSDLDGDGRAELVAVHKSSGRMSSYAFTELAGARALGREPLERPLEPAEARRAYALGDLDGDGADEIALADPAAAQVVLYRGGRQGARAPERHATLVGALDPHIGRLDGSPGRELALISRSERMLAVASLDAAGRMAFPRTLPVEGEPIALELADVDGDGFDDALAIVAQGEGRNRKYALHQWSGSAEGLREQASVQALDTLKKDPTALRAADLDRDGDIDLIAFVPGEKSVPLLILRSPEGLVADSRGADAPGLGILADAAPHSIAVCGPQSATPGALLVASSNFARALYFERDARGLALPRVLEQYGAPSSDARVAAVLSIDDAGQHRLVLFDAARRELAVLERLADGSTRPLERIQAGRLELAGLARADRDGDGRADLCVLGENQFGVVFASSRALDLEERASHDPEGASAFLDRIAVGDLDADGKRDVAVTEDHQHRLLVLSAPLTELAHGFAATVFEEKTFTGETRQREPREMLCRDLDGDGRDDLALVAHDKLLVYRQ